MFNIYFHSSYLYIHSFISKSNKVACFINRKSLYSIFTNNNDWKDVKYIHSISNPIVTKLASLRDKKYRQKHNLVLLEGYRQVIEAIESNIEPDCILIQPDSLDTSFSISKGIKESLQRFIFSDKIRFVDEKVISKIGDTVTSQGIVASFMKPSYDIKFAFKTIKDSCLIKDKPLILVLDELSDPGNIGTLIRSSYGFGVDAIFIAGNSCDIWSPKVIRSSMGSILKLPIYEIKWESNDLSLLLQEFENNDMKLQVLLTDVNEKCVDYSSIDYNQPVVFIIGSEANGIGLHAKRLAKDSKSITIPMSRSLESLNAATAGSVILGEISRQRQM